LDTGYSKINELYRSFSTSSIQEGAAIKKTEETEWEEEIAITNPFKKTEETKSMLTFKQPTE
jgi:hypothetical protein